MGHINWATMTQCPGIPVCESKGSSYSVTKNKKAETFQRKSFIL